MRRDKTEINTELLRISQTGALKTQLVYKGNLNFNMIKKYLRTLMDRGLIQKTGAHYYTTERGREFIYHAESLGAI